MKKDIHPKTYNDCKVTCACGNSFTTISTIPSINVEICSNCHPFFTGQQKFVDTEGRIDKFHKKAQLMQEKKQSHETSKKSKKGKAKNQDSSAQRETLKDLMKKLREEEKAKDNSDSTTSTDSSEKTE